MDVPQAVLGIAIFSAAVAALFGLVTRGTRRVLGPKRRLESALGMQVLDGRHRRGEITDAEYEVAKQAIGG